MLLWGHWVSRMVVLWSRLLVQIPLFDFMVHIDMSFLWQHMPC